MDVVLKHHGVPGQRWGKRNGPPYPLYRQARFKNRRPHSPINTGDVRERNNEKTKRSRVKKGLKIVDEEFIQPEVKKALVIAGITALGAATTYVMLQPKCADAAYKALETLAGEKTDNVINLAMNGKRFAKRALTSKTVRTGIKVAATVDAAITAKKAFNRAVDEGVIKVSKKDGESTAKKQANNNSSNSKMPKENVTSQEHQKESKNSRYNVRYSPSIKALMSGYKKKEDAPNSLFDIDDYELIVLNIDNPAFREEYGISEADYRRYKSAK